MQVSIYSILMLATKKDLLKTKKDLEDCFDNLERTTYQIHQLAIQNKKRTELLAKHLGVTFVTFGFAPEHEELKSIAKRSRQKKK